MDVLDAGDYYEEWADFKETDPMNENYDFFGIGDKNFIMNSGSYFPFFASFIVINMSLWILNKLAAWMAHKEMWRNLGLKVYSSSYFQDFNY